MRRKTPSNNSRALTAENVRIAKRLLSKDLKAGQLEALREMTLEFGLSLLQGELLLLDGKWYVTHAGLLRLAQRRGCRGIQTRSLREFCDAEAGRCVFKATVYKGRFPVSLPSSPSSAA